MHMPYKYTRQTSAEDIRRRLALRHTVVADLTLDASMSVATFVCAALLPNCFDCHIGKPIPATRVQIRQGEGVCAHRYLNRHQIASQASGVKECHATPNARQILRTPTP